MIRTGYDPRRSAFEDENGEGMGYRSTREKEVARDIWRSGIVSRAEQRKADAKADAKREARKADAKADAKREARRAR